MSDVKLAVKAILDGQRDYVTAGSYYDGDVAEKSFIKDATLRAAFRNTGSAYRLNFARSVVDAVLDRMEIAAVKGTTPTADKMINKIWEQNELSLEADEIHRRALVYGDCYAIVWPDESGEMLISYNSPTTTTLVYDVENPRKKAFGAKMWKEETDQGTINRLNLYYADSIQKWRTRAEDITDGTIWYHSETIDNPFGEVPVFHFRTSRPSGRPEHRDAFEPQDMINKLVITQMYTVDYQGAPQRYALANGDSNSEVEDFEEGATPRENMQALQNGPGKLWFLRGVTDVGQFEPADPDQFWKPIKDLVRSMASMTSTPLHYFERTGNVPSGEALRTAEAPLLKKVKDRQLSFGSAWRDMFRFILKAEGIDADVQVKWQPVESMDSLDSWDVALKKRNAGVSLLQVLLEQGYDLEIAQEIADKYEQDKAADLEKKPNQPEVAVQT